MPRARVAVRSTKDTDVVSAVETVMDLCGWRDVVSEGAHVVVKPNLCTPSEELIEVANVCPDVLSAVCKVLRTRTERVTIGESDGIRYTAEEAFAMNDTYRVAEECGCELISFSQDDWVQVDHPHLEGWGLPKTLLECDVFITVAKIKTHATTTFTGALKNQWGCIPQHDRLLLHKYLHTLIGDVNKILGPQLGIIDGLVGMEGRGPINGQPVHLDVVMASRDVVALDASAMRFVGLDPATAAHVVHAAEIGFGPMAEEEIECDSDVAPEHTFEPAEKDWPIKMLNLISHSQFLTKHLLMNDTIFFPARWFANRCRATKAWLKGKHYRSRSAGKTVE